jgi:sugar phosphate isomerase/epimerase
MPIAFGFPAPRATEDIERVARRLAGEGYQWLEVIAPKRLDPELEAVVRRSKDEIGLGVTVHAQVFDANLSVTHPVLREAAVRVHKLDLDFASRIGATGVVVHGGVIGWTDYLPPDHPQYAETLLTIENFRRAHQTALVTSIEELGDYAERLGLWIGVENLSCPQEMLTTPDELAGVLEKISARSVGATLDFGHSLVAGQSPLDYVSRLGSRIKHLHVHDNDGQYDVHLPIRELRKDWAAALELLNSSPTPIVAILEVLTPETDHLSSSLRAVRRGMRLEE